MADQERLDFDRFYDHLHVTGLAHLDLLTDTAQAIRSHMSDATTTEERFAYTHHLLAVPQAMLRWSMYLIPKEEAQEREKRCEECETEEENDSE